MTATEFKGPIVEGAYYEREDGRIVGPARDTGARSSDFRWKWELMGGTYMGYDEFGNNWSQSSNDRLTRRVYITHTDPAEVDENLRVMTAMEGLARKSNGHLQQVAIMAKDDLRALQAKAAEVVAELRIPTCHHANPYGCGWDEGRYAAADLVAEKLVGGK